MHQNNFFTFFFFLLTITGFAQTDINLQLERLDWNRAGLKEIIQLFGEPEKYIWGQQTFTKENLPAVFMAAYPKGPNVVLQHGKIGEIRFEGPTEYRYKNKLTFGSSLETALEVLGAPIQTVAGQKNEFKDGMLYRDIDQQKGHCYYQRSDQNIRLFFSDYKVIALFLTNPQMNKKDGPEENFMTVRPVDQVNPFDDVRFKDLSRLTNLTENLVQNLRFNQETVWPANIRLSADTILQKATDPGLGIRQLHQAAITGKGVNVAIIDQPLFRDHPEFAGKMAAYHDVGCGSESSMHGPAVMSLLAGEHCGTAPGVKVFYAAAPSWTGDTAYQAQALEWIIDQNHQLPAGQKIRVVSVSAAPSGAGSPFTKNNELWDQACQKAEAAGIMVLDCTSHHGFISPAHFAADLREKPQSCVPGLPSHPAEKGFKTSAIYVPTCPRTTAEEYVEGKCRYAYWGQGGLSWAIPYTAGVLAMGWQVRPEATPEEMKKLLFQSAYVTKDGAKVIHPPAFIEAVKNAQKGRNL